MSPVHHRQPGSPHQSFMLAGSQPPTTPLPLRGLLPEDILVRGGGASSACREEAGFHLGSGLKQLTAHPEFSEMIHAMRSAVGRGSEGRLRVRAATTGWRCSSDRRRCLASFSLNIFFFQFQSNKRGKVSHQTDFPPPRFWEMTISGERFSNLGSGFGEKWIQDGSDGLPNEEVKPDQTSSRRAV